MGTPLSEAKRPVVLLGSVPPCCATGLFVTGRNPLKATVIVTLAPGLGPTERSAYSPDAKRRLRRQGWRHQCSPLGPPAGRPQRLNEGSSDEQ